MSRLAPAEAGRVGAHRAGCDACRQQLVHLPRTGEAQRMVLRVSGLAARAGSSY